MSYPYHLILSFNIIISLLAYFLTISNYGFIDAILHPTTLIAMKEFSKLVNILNLNLNILIIELGSWRLELKDETIVILQIEMDEFRTDLFWYQNLPVSFL